MRTRARTLMIQGTASSVGKSLLVTALCRIFRQDGVRVAPFKSQNMALNSAVTPGGFEIGRAQAVQAQAAGIAPTVEMNPILLKPEPGMRSQIVMMGRVAGTMNWSEYHSRHEETGKVIASAFEALRSRYDLVLIEGAGSPAEVNLRHQDLVNMYVARLAESPVLLAGDIDRGGVFAQLVGTMDLLDADDRARVAALIVNKFRGERNLFAPGVEFLERRCGVPVLGVVPFIERLRIADEDSVALQDRPRVRGASDRLDIAVIRLPSISNYDDFLPLEHEAGVSVRFTDDAAGIENADLVIIPGSKSTVHDLDWIKRHGFAGAIVKRAAVYRPVLGICGGCQMLGDRIDDPDHIESQHATVEGIGQLGIVTRFEAQKRTTQVRAHALGESILTAGTSEESLSGYEIHLGRVVRNEKTRAAFRIVARNGLHVDELDGAVSTSGNIVGTMIHGIFENDSIRRNLLRTLAERRGLKWSNTPDADAAREAGYDRLADEVRTSLDMAAIRRIAGIA
jgi:adenosylcobyric acid synthase